MMDLKSKKWFMDNATKFIWYNSDRGVDENEFSVEDGLEYFANRKSIA